MRVITDDIGKVVERMRPFDVKYGQPALDYIEEFGTPANAALMPYYEPGHRLAIANMLLQKENDQEFKYQKYPLVAFRLDVRERVGPKGMIHYHNLNIVFLAFTDHNYTYSERLEKVIKPILIPMYERFFEELRNVGIFTWGAGKKPPHERIIRPYWGKENTEGNKAFLFNDPLDAIEIIDLEFSAQEKC